MENKSSLIFQAISMNGQKYIEEKIGRLLNEAMIQFISHGKKSGDYSKFLKANGLVEEKQYQFMKADEEPSSPMTSGDSEPSFEDSPSDFIDMMVKIKNREEESIASTEKVIPNQKYLKKKRKAVFSNPADVLEQDSSFVPPKYEKSESERVKIKNSLMKNMLTKKLSVDHINTLINAMQKRQYKKEDILITFGEEGKEYFILESGILECKVFSEETKEVVVTKTITEGNAFGELALLYQTPRSATITALTDCSAWVLDQMTFKTVIMSSAIRERNIRLNFVDKIKVFEKMSKYEKIKLLDGLEVQYFEQNDIIVKEGDVGEYFYIIEEGGVNCIKEENNQVIRELTIGDYFGELALIEQGQKRTLTVKATTDCKLLVLNRDTFFSIMSTYMSSLGERIKQFYADLKEGSDKDDSPKEENAKVEQVEYVEEPAKEEVVIADNTSPKAPEEPSEPVPE